MTEIVPKSAEMDFFVIDAELTRRAHGVTQQSVAEQLGVSRQHIGLIENGDRKMDLEFACKWARVKGLRLALLPVEG
jgi:transcriptional regulator with XRE-family HTH domain